MPETWSDKYNLGIETIDAQHRTFFDATQKLFDAILVCEGEDVVEGALTFLKTYAAEHFQTEETLIEKHGYPKLAEHKKLHADFMAILDDFDWDLNQSQVGTQALADEVLAMTQVWLLDHITYEDTKYAKHIAETS